MKTIRASIAHSALALCAVLLSLWPSSAAEFYTNWAAAHLSDIPVQSGPLADPDHDGETNLVEFAFGTDPRVAGDFHALIFPRLCTSNGVFGLELLEQAGHQPGAQIDLYLSGNLTNWFRPWWQRSATNSQPFDPPGSVREWFTTVLPPRTNVWFARAGVQLFEVGPENTAYYVATNGSDTNSGTSISQPFATLSKAAGLANPGSLIYLRGGAYHWTAKVSLSRSGSFAQPIRVRAYPGEQPTLDFSGQAFSSSNRGIEIAGNWWCLYGLEIVGAGDNGIYVTGKSNILERCVAHDCRDSGFQLHSGAAYNLVFNCDSYRNYDPTPGNYGENADGFAAKFQLGPGNVFRGCRSWENSDDGWDVWEATNEVVIEYCWTFRNGTNFLNYSPFGGDGGGFKLGGNYLPGAHRISHCVSFSNKANGYDQNNNAAGLTVDQNTAWANGSKNFNLNHGAVTQGVHVVRNNVSIAGANDDSFAGGTLQTNNSWQVLSAVASTTDFLSANIDLALAPRRDDGGLPEMPFLRPIPNGRLVDKGVALGELFQGGGPDLGAFETPAW
jgi:hypothetical protein